METDDTTASISAKGTTQFQRARKYLSEIFVDGVSTKQYKCQLCPHNKQLCGNTHSNLVSHFKSKHKKVYVENIIGEKEENVHVRRLKTVHSCVELVTVNSLPFSVLSSSGFRSLLEDKLRVYQLAGCGLNLSDHHVYEIKEKIKQVADEIRSAIKEEVKGKIISVMIDSATRNGRSIFGINIQYKHNGVMKIVTLAQRELKSSHTAIYLADVLVNILSEYGIELLQVLSITSDNGSNMLAMIKDVENILFGDNDCDSNVDSEQVNSTNKPTSSAFNQSVPSSVVDDEQVDNEIEDFLNAETIFDEDDALDMLLDETTTYEDLLEKLVIDVRERSGNHRLFVTTIRCAAHSLQLAVRDALKLLGKSDINAISLCRHAAKFLRRQSTRNEMNSIGLSAALPVLDVKTRWSSTYKMVSVYFEQLFIFY